jgi:hypothetical protein
MLQKYTVENIRAIVPKGKVAEKNPDRVLTIHGQFFNEKGEKLSFSQKEITRDMIANTETVVDLANGILILPAGERGRKAAVSVSQDEVNSLLDSLRNPAAK